MDHSAEVEEMKAAYLLYDRYVDIMSSFEMLFEQSDTPLPENCRHFERFPTISHNGKKLTPDFTVLYADGSATIFELARFALLDKSVDKLCSQLLNYDGLLTAPGPKGPEQVDRLDVVLIVPVDLGTDALRRILDERFADPDHAYSPANPPSILQYVFDSDKYVIQRLQHPLNAAPSGGPPGDNLGALLERDFKPKPQYFMPFKARTAFMNDPVPPLYLATHLWAKVFPDLAPTTKNNVARIETTASDLAQNITARFGRVKTADVTNALKLLSNARLARQESSSFWTIAWHQIHATRRNDLEDVLAERACSKPKTGPVDKLKPDDGQGRLTLNDDYAEDETDDDRSASSGEEA